MNLYRAFATVGGLTMVSRVLGFFRDILLAAVFGTGLVADAFVVAFRFPNLFRRWFGEGAFNAAFVPLFAKKLEGDGREAARAFAEEAMAGLTFILIFLSALCMIGMPWLMYVLAPGFADTVGEVRPCRADVTHRFPVPAVHVAGGTAVGRSEHVRQVRRELAGLGGTQSNVDCGDAGRLCFSDFATTAAPGW